MPTTTSGSKLLFVINPGSGNNDIDFEDLIDQFAAKHREIRVGKHMLDNPADCEALKAAVLAYDPDKVIAVGGDGTIKLVAEQLMGSGIPIGILPAGSANGMAKELGIPTDPEQALDLILTGNPHKIHLLKVNNELCIHLSDIGFNAYVVKTFDNLPHRGMFGYIKAAWHVLWRHYRMKAVFSIDDQVVEREAVMIVMANATSYGTGIRINPEGRLDDNLFEVIIIKKISLIELLKMGFTRLPFNPRKTELYQTSSLLVRSRKKVHFQVDGEYLGKVNEVRAELLPKAATLIY